MKKQLFSTILFFLAALSCLNAQICIPGLGTTICNLQQQAPETLTNVTFQEINNTTGCDGYADFTSQIATVTPGETYTLTVSAIFDGDLLPDSRVLLFIDWNGNEQWDVATERYIIIENPPAANHTFTYDVVVPNDAVVGQVRMRVANRWNTNDWDGCTTSNYLDAEDYTLDVQCISPSISAHPVNSSICEGEDTTFAVTASGSELAYQWQVNTGGGFSNISNGATYSNVTTATLNITAATADMDGYLYRCVITGACGSDTSNNGTLTVQVQPNAGTNGALSICAGVTLTEAMLFDALGGTPDAGGDWSPPLDGAGTYTYTVNATSPCTGNATAEVVATDDDEDPVISCPADITQTNDPGECGAVVIYTDPIASDNCMTPSSELELLQNGLFETGVLTPWTYVGPISAGCDQDFRIYSGNYDSCGFLNNFGLNMTPPEGIYGVSGAFDGAGPLERKLQQSVVLPSDFSSISLQFYHSYYVNLQDSCGGCLGVRMLDVEILSADETTILSNAFSLTFAPGSNYSQAFTLVQLDLSGDLSGYAGQDVILSFKITIPEFFTGPGWYALDAVSLTSASDIIIQTAGLPSGSVFPVGTTTNTFEVTDSSGNTSTCSFDVIVEDNEVPVITAPVSGETIELTPDMGGCAYTHTGTDWDASATDNCNLTLDFSYVLTGATGGSGTSLDGVVFNFGVTTVTWTADDGNGNISVDSFAVSVYSLDCIPNKMIQILPDRTAEIIKIIITPGVIVNNVALKDNGGADTGIPFDGVEMDMSSLSEGMYFLTVDTNIGVVNQTIAKM